MEYKFPEFNGEDMRFRTCSDALLVMCLFDVITAPEYGELMLKLHNAYKEGKLKNESRL